MHQDIYQENILDHYKNPRNKREIDGAHEEAFARNASCGDKGGLHVCFNDAGVVIDTAFQGEGCAISQAALSMLTEKLRGKTLRDLKLLTPGDIYTMLGVSISPGRANCALLGYAALEKILKMKQ